VVRIDESAGRVRIRNGNRELDLTFERDGVATYHPPTLQPSAPIAPLPVARSVESIPSVGLSGEDQLQPPAENFVGAVPVHVMRSSRRVGPISEVRPVFSGTPGFPAAPWPGPLPLRSIAAPTPQPAPVVAVPPIRSAVPVALFPSKNFPPTVRDLPPFIPIGSPVTQTPHSYGGGDSMSAAEMRFGMGDVERSAAWQEAIEIDPDLARRFQDEIQRQPVMQLQP